MVFKLVMKINNCYIATDEIPGFFLLLKNHILIAHSEDTFLSFTCEDIGLNSMEFFRKSATVLVFELSGV